MSINIQSYKNLITLTATMMIFMKC